MKLSYRGVDYDFNPFSLQARGAKHRLNNVAKARTLGALLTYRGAAYSIAPSTQTESASPSVAPGTMLTYRGICYTVQPETVQPTLQAAPAQAVTATKASVRSLEDQARALTMNHHRATKKRQLAMLLRSAADVGMPVATAS
ncbi:DUF4278 domain-containing protein [Leptolyngbya sp. FACHB-321]|uniref:DUF4278 domain-containing protein n=1 Tax=Leptolyngbya sp. FACHB-321 TaxID=2692807 RepID=UPI001682880D|nr:DUF4278 domain-containing protein [Leptolyngbya sp. FACHB-321]MBD2035214.1 DUF4278 domain-containing protein [Leptolyngbya sp. FACHB-321]